MEQLLTDRQTQILDAAVAIIGESGMTGLTIRNVARSVGITEPGVYRHFPSKLELLKALLGRVETTMGGHYLATVKEGEPGREPREILTAFFTAMFQEFRTMPALIPLLFTDELFHQEPRLRLSVSSMVEAQISRFSILAQRFQREGFWRRDIDPEQIAVILLGTVRLTVIRIGPDDDPEKRAAAVAPLLQSLFAAAG